MNILYLHGLESKPSPPKTEILQKYSQGNVSTPVIDYKSPNLQNFIFEELEKSKADAIIGSSAGGLMAYVLAKYAGVPALLFNPALYWISELNFKFETKQTIKENYVYSIILGAKDEVVNPKITLDFLEKNENPSKYSYKFLENLEHRIDLSTFENEVKEFINTFFS
jgi:predicted esterase YcpF (UPF0227 family)